MKTATAVVAALLVVTGCSKKDPPSEMSVTKTCVQTACDKRQQEDGNACSRCTDACLSADFDCDPSESCSSSCSFRDCSDHETSECVQQGFVVDPSHDADADLQAACQRAVEHVNGCGGAGVPESTCATWAKTERPERAADYDCLTGLSCGADPSSCGPAPDTFGDDLCDKLEGKCPRFCTKDIRTTLDADGPWLRDDVRNAGLSCADQDACSDAHDCFDAWAKAASL